jgi:signal transduction histidine kinase/CheY-like chemotaxis protein
MGVFDLRLFSLEDMYRCSAEIRRIGEKAADTDEAALRVVSYLFERAVIRENGAPACPLVRLFRTDSLDTLDPKDRTYAEATLPSDAPPNTTILCLRASRGIQPEWNDPSLSRAHRLIPLVSAQAIAKMPMVSGLVTQLGLPVGIFGGSPLVGDDPNPLFDAFHVEEARGSTLVPDQAHFVEQFGIRSVLGFGGLLPPSRVFAVILFSSVSVTKETAALFRMLAPSVSVALLASGRDPASFETRINAYERVLKYHEQVALSHHHRLRRADEELERLLASESQARNAAQEASRAKDDFMAILGHELRNPLSPIVTAIEVMRLRGVSSREQEIIERQARHLGRLVDDLLDVSRIARGKVDLHRGMLEVSDIVQRGVEMASPLFEKRGQRLVVDVPFTGLPVFVDPARLAQVISNLLTNASKFSGAGCEVRIAAWRAGQIARISVHDQGIGIPADMLVKIFDSFVQHRVAGQEGSSGLGLGLSVVRSLVRLHGGTVTAQSGGKGQGSEFVVELPLAAWTQDALSVNSVVATAPTRPLPGGCGKRVLLVDDNPDAAELLSVVLMQLGYEVAVAADGPSALRLAPQFEPEVALLDIGLNVMDGYELARRLLLLTPISRKPRLIAITGYGQESDRRRSAEAGFAMHLVKPVTLEVLAKALTTD